MGAAAATARVIEILIRGGALALPGLRTNPHNLNQVMLAEGNLESTNTVSKFSKIPQGPYRG